MDQCPLEEEKDHDDVVLVRRWEASFAELHDRLRNASDRFQLRQCTGTLLNAASDCLLDLDSHHVSTTNFPVDLLRENFFLVLDHLGPGNEQMRHCLLELIQELQRNETRQVALDFLPLVMPVSPLEEVSAHVVEVLVQLFHRDSPSAIAPILQCISTLTNYGIDRAEPFHLALQGLPRVVDVNDIPTVIECLLRNVVTEMDADAAWEALRSEWLQLETAKAATKSTTDSRPSLALVSNVVLSIVLCSEMTDILAESILTTLETNPGDNQNISTLDLIVVQTLSTLSNWELRIEKLLDTWLSVSGMFPWRALGALISLVLSNEEGEPRSSLLHRRVAPTLIRLAICLLLAPARVEINPSTKDEIASYVLRLHSLLNPEKQRELVQCMFHLNEETLAWEMQCESTVRTNSRKKARHVKATSIRNKRTLAQVVRRWNNSVLQAMAETSQASILPLRHSLVAYLTSPNCEIPRHGHEMIQDVCSILARLTSPDAARDGGSESSEIMTLLQKLFLSVPALDRTKIDSAATTRLERGVCLATELVRTSAIAPTDQDCVTEWVYRLLLPSTKRMVDPILGNFGLAYLECVLLSKDAASASNVFRHLKALVSNTGLIQLLHNYQQQGNKRDDTVMAYHSIPKDFEWELEGHSSPRRMVFCVAFFLKRSSHHCPALWVSITDWVQRLVTLYLRLGRERATKGWQSQGWLLAPVELFRVHFSLDSSPVLALLEKKLSCFDYVAESCGDEKNDAIVDSFPSCIVGVDIQKVVDLLFLHTLSVWIAVGLSTAVLQNSFQDYQLSESSNTVVSTQGMDRFKLLDFELLKMYSMRSKLRLLQSVLLRLCTSLQRQGNKEGKGYHAKSSGTGKLIDPLHVATKASNEMERKYFQSGSMIPPKIMWMSLCNDQTAWVVREAVTKLSTTAHRVTQDLGSAFRVMKLKAALAAHLSILILSDSKDGSVDFRETHCCFLLELSKFLCDSLPRLRKGYFAFHRTPRADGFSLEEVLSFTREILSLLRAVLVRGLSPRGEFPLFSKACINGLTAYSAGVSKDPNVSSAPVVVGFQVFRAALGGTDSLPLAVALLDFLSMFALHANESQVEEVINDSWMSLQTIYATTDQTMSPAEPFVVGYVRDRLERFSTSEVSLYQDTFGKLYSTHCNGGGLLPYRVMLIQHLALVSVTPDILARYSDQLVKLVSAVEVQHGYPVDKSPLRDETKSSSEPGDTDQRSHPHEAFPFFSKDPSEEFVEILLYGFAGILTICDPATRHVAGEALGPYVHIGVVIHLFRRLLLVYQFRFHHFSRRFTVDLFDACNCFVRSALSQMDRCIAWRNIQPFPLQGSSQTQYDRGSTTYLKRLLDSFGVAIGSVIDLCEFWQAKPTDTRHTSKSTRLRQVTENGLRLLNKAATMHNLPPPSQTTVDENPYDIQVVQIAAQSMNQEKAEDHRKARSAEQETQEDDYESDVSFCATGEWGNTSMQE